MVQRTVLKVQISCLKCKRQLIKAVSSLQGVDKIEVDEGKGTVTVTGDADPYEVIVRTRKTGKFVEVVSIGPPPAPQQKKDSNPKATEEKKQDQGKKSDGGKPDQLGIQFHDPHTCPVCQHVALSEMAFWEEPRPYCSIL